MKRLNKEANSSLKKPKIDDDFSQKMDFFRQHFCQNLSDDLAESLKGKQCSKSVEKIKLKLGKFLVTRASTSSIMHCTDPTNELSFSEFGINSKLIKNFPITNSGDLTSQQSALYQIIGRYMDLLYVSKGINYLPLICLHSINHITRTRNLVVNNKNHLEALTEQGKITDDDIENARDQGFSRPKVLILSPFRKFAYEIVHGFIKLVFGDEKKTFVMNLNKFDEEYGDDRNRIHEKRDVAQEYKDLMSGNIDDCFRIGIGLAKKSLKLYTSFDESDILLCSPLGLRMIIGDSVESHHERDFLSSIEVLIVDHAHVMLMQNWEHVLHIFENVNEIPSKIHVDISRVRHWSIKNLPKLYRQTIVFSELNFTELHTLFNLYAKNYAGMISAFAVPSPVLDQIEIPITQELHRFDIDDPKNQSDFRFNYFVKNILPQCESGTLIFISSYFDYIRLRNYLKREEESFVQLHEYAKDVKIARARDLFFHGKKKFILLTERFHFFRRYRIKGIKSLVFYQLPVNPQFYTELINFSTPDENEKLLSKLIFSKFDSFRLQNVFGLEQARQLIRSEKRFHALLSE